MRVTDLRRFVLRLLALLVLIATAPAPAQAERIINRWTSTKMAVSGSDAVLVNAEAQDNLVVELNDDGFYMLKSIYSDQYLNIENGNLAMSVIQPGWWSAQWTFEDAGGGYIRIKNRWKDVYLNNEKGPLTASAIQSGWWSAQWKREREFVETYKSPIALGAGGSTKIRNYGEYAWLTSHNSHVNYSDSRWSAASQSKGIVGQLNDGVRGLMLDVYDFAGSGDARCVFSATADCYPSGVYLCHANCTEVAGMNYALPRQKLKDTLDAIGDWLTTHKEERDVVTIFFEDYTADGTLAAVIRSSRAAPFIFNPNHSGWSVAARGWPSLLAMKQANQRLVLFTNNAGNADTSLGLSHDQSFNVENAWSLGDAGTNTECKSRWDDIPLNKRESAFNRLFVMNHYRNVPTTFTAAVDNQMSNLQTRLSGCKAAAGKLPNFIALDFVELGSGADFVVDLNGKWVEAVNK